MIKLIPFAAFLGIIAMVAFWFFFEFLASFIGKLLSPSKNSDAPTEKAEAAKIRREEVIQKHARVIRRTSVAETDLEKRQAHERKRLRFVNKEDREKKRETLKEKKLARIEAKKTELHRLRAIAARDSAKSRERADELKKSLRRLNHQQSRCPYCDGELINKHLDHIIPLGRGGLSVPENLVFVCGKCNEEKSSDTLTMFVKRRGFDRDAVERRLSAMGKVF